MQIVKRSATEVWVMSCVNTRWADKPEFRFPAVTECALPVPCPYYWWSPASLSCSSTPLLQWLSALPSMLMGGVVASGSEAVVWLHTMKIAFGAQQKAAGTVTFPLNFLELSIPTACVLINAFWFSFFFLFLYLAQSLQSFSAHMLLVLLRRCVYTFNLLIYVQVSSEKN